MKEFYELIDSGSGLKLERFGPYVIQRPASQAVWLPSLSSEVWKKADALFSREPSNSWQNMRNIPPGWTIKMAEITFKLSQTDFGHLGIFPEQCKSWKWIQEVIRKELEVRSRPLEVLNLFAYSGGSTLAAAKAGANVCHLDASKGMVAWARENADLNGLSDAPIRWIVDDVTKFLKRELKRDRRYDAIILDPPTFGRGAKGEIFKIEENINEILMMCRELLSSDPLFILFSCHSPGFTPTTMKHLLSGMMKGLKGNIQEGEMFLEGSPNALQLPSGTFARWERGI